MLCITSEEIESLNIAPETCVEWVREAFLMKDRCQLPPKVSLHPQRIDFFNTMPCLLPPEYHTYGCKVVSRIAGNYPALKSEILVFDTRTGGLIALMNGDWITAMRTGAVAALAINTLRKKDACIYSFMGLGVIGHATLNCLLSSNRNRKMTIRLLRYKDHAEKTIKQFDEIYPLMKFEIVDGIENLIKDSDVVVSCITEAKNLLVEDTSLFKPGVLVVPVHTRGFQNCDTVFDKVIADDEGHVKGFKYFNQFKKFGELDTVLKGNTQGRENENERILSYNVGIGIHDILFALNILQMFNKQQITPPSGLAAHLIRCDKNPQ